jgi:hypothetical protein
MVQKSTRLCMVKAVRGECMDILGHAKAAAKDNADELAERGRTAHEGRLGLGGCEVGRREAQSFARRLDGTCANTQCSAVSTAMPSLSTEMRRAGVDCVSREAAPPKSTPDESEITLPSAAAVRVLRPNVTPNVASIACAHTKRERARGRASIKRGPVASSERLCRCGFLPNHAVRSRVAHVAGATPACIMMMLSMNCAARRRKLSDSRGAPDNAG